MQGPILSLETLGAPIVCGPTVREMVKGDVFQYLQIVPTPDGKHTLIGRKTKGGHAIFELDKVNPSLEGYYAFWLSLPRWSFIFYKWTDDDGVDVFMQIQRHNMPQDLWIMVMRAKHLIEQTLLKDEIAETAS